MTFRFFHYVSVFALLVPVLLLAERPFSPATQVMQSTIRNTELDHDVAAVSLVAPTTVEGGKMQLLQAVAKNVGSNTETFDVEFGYLEWDGTFTVKRTRTVTDLPPGETKNISFGFYTFPKNVEYDYFIRTKLPEDMNTDNDVVTQAINSFENGRDVVLIEKFTGTWCPYCPGAALCVDELKKDFPGQVAAIDYHVGDDYENAQCRPHVEYYQIEGYPTAKFNGISEIVGGTSAYGWEDLYMENYSPRFRAALNHGTCLNMDMQYQDNNGNITAFIELAGLAPSYVRSYRLFCVVVENHIKKSWGGLDSLQHVFRGVYPNWDGVPFIKDEPINAGVTYSGEISFNMPQNVVKENCEIIAFVQNVENQVVMAAAIGDEIETLAAPFEVMQHDSVATDTTGAEMVFEGTVRNLTSSPITVDFNRVENNIPEDWTSAICLDLCLAPWVDEASATIPAGDSLVFSLHFFTGPQPGVGSIKMLISDSTGIKTDSLLFTASTVWPTGVSSAPVVSTFELIGNYPNPFNPTTTIEYSVAEPCSAVRLKVYSARGRQVAETHLNGIQPGVHRYSFDASDFGAGIYMYQLVFETPRGTFVSQAKKFTLLK